MYIIPYFTKDKIENLILSIDTFHAEKVAAQMSKSCRPNRRWAVLIDNPEFTQLLICDTFAGRLSSSLVFKLGSYAF